MRNPRSTTLASLCVVVLLAAACGTSAPSGGGAPSSTPSPAPPGCEPLGGVGPRSAPGRRPDGGVALLGNVQVQASRCVDEVSFLFFGAARPDWSVSYAEGPFTADPSGAPMEVAGSAVLEIRLEPASGVDLSGAEAHQIYDGPSRIRPQHPSGVVEVVRAGDFEAVSTWLVALGAERPFEVVERDEQLVVRIAAGRPRVTRCDLEGAPLSIGFPADWFAEVSDRWRCQYFDPRPFVVHPSTNDFRWQVTAQAADAPAATVLERLAQDDSRVVRADVRVAGFPATRMDLTASGRGLLPAGWSFRLYVIDAGARAVILTGAAAADPAAASRHAAAVDEIAALARAR